MNLPTSELRVLVATADRRLNLRLAATLAKLGPSAQPAADGATALELLLAPNPPEIALLDTALPGQSGLELAAALKRRPGTKQTWIMLLSR
ncbi:MAG: hypothetical protein ACREBW_02000, partial [Candidatus Micrarchaeaceae archaeon]